MLLSMVLVIVVTYSCALYQPVAGDDQPQLDPPTNSTDRDDDDDRPLAARRARRLHRRLPKRIRDILPEPAPPLPPPPTMADIETTVAVPSTPARITESIVGCVRRVLRTPRNTFGLIRQYFADKFPEHDPEENLSLQDLSSLPATDSQDSTAASTKNFYPYPNENSFRLGDWYWNHGAQKSHEDFRALLDIVGDASFHPRQIRDTKWDHIDRQLAADDGEWTDEGDGWRKSSVTIPIPFHRRMAFPGPRHYVVTDFHHRPLVSVIREKLKNHGDNRLFHYEPYELFWQPNDDRPEVRVHGELYTSPAFVEAHQQLQDSPGEPDCNLPRVVLGLMFASDSTHLTSFGNTKLWPLYCYFGNESKYRRCKPSCNLCCHVAYFQKV
jgi:Plavaka transposase